MKRRDEFKHFIEKFGKDEDVLKFRLVHEKLSSKQCWEKFGFNNSINLVIRKDELFKQLSSTEEKILMLQENTKNRLFDIEDLNEKGFAVYILPNLAHRKADIEKIYCHTWDYDCGKEVYNLETEEEAEQLAHALSLREDIETDSIEIVPLKRKKQPFVVRAYRTVEEINRLKGEFIKKHKDDLLDCLVNSSPNGFRGFYFYEEAIAYDEAQYTAIQQGIIEKFDGDKAFIQPSQAIRVSGFYHNKRKPQMVSTFLNTHSFVTVEEMKKRFPIIVDEEEAEVNEVSKPVIALRDVEYKSEMTFVEAIDFLQQQDITVVFSELSYKHNFCCHFHSDNNPSASLGINKRGVHLYGCFSDNCGVKKNIIDLYISMEFEGDRRKFKEAVIELAKFYNVKVVESDFYIKEVTKYQRNMKWIVDMFDNGSLQERYPVLSNKFFRNTVRYLKDKDKNFILNASGEKQKRVIRSKREQVLRHLTFYGNARLQDINIEGNSLFWISFRHLSELMLGNVSNEKFEQEKAKIFYLVKELELLGFIQQVDIKSVPQNIRRKAEKLAHIKYKDGKEYQKHTISFYTMNDFYEVEEEIDRKAVELKDKGYRNTVHRGKVVMEIVEGTSTANQLYQHDQEQEMNPFYLQVKKHLVKHIEKSVRTKGYFSKDEIVKSRIRIMSGGEYFYVSSKDKRKILDIFLYGDKGILKKLGMVERKMSLKIADELNFSKKEYQSYKCKYIFMREG